MLLVYRYRIKSLTGLLNSQARACNYVWNFCNDTQQQALKWNKRWPSGFDLNRLTAGSSKELALHAGTINAVCEQYAKSRRQWNRPFLRWRGRRSLGWVPLKGRDLKRSGEAFRFAGNTFRVFHSRLLPEGKIKDGTNFSCDARGHWFLNIVVEVAAPAARPVCSGIGIDLGLKDFAVLSIGEKIENPRHLRQLADKLAAAQRARKRRQTTNIYARITHARRDFHHKLSTRIVREFDYGAWYEEVNESFSTRVCSFCKCETGPKGVADLGIRSWVCAECGVLHDRDINSAQNIRSGHRTPAEGIPALEGGEDVKVSVLPRQKSARRTTAGRG
jgi:putative transposase